MCQDNGVMSYKHNETCQVVLFHLSHASWNLVVQMRTFSFQHDQLQQGASSGPGHQVWMRNPGNGHLHKTQVQNYNCPVFLWEYILSLKSIFIVKQN